MPLRTPARLFVAAALAVALAVTSAGAAEAKPRFPDRIELPVGFQPEGIAIGKGPWAYLGSRVDGDIYATNLKTGRGKVISQGPGTPSLGLKVDGKRLFVSGGNAGNGRIVSLRDGQILASYAFAPDASTANPSFVNDVVLTRRTAWFTDSSRPQLYGLARTAHGKAMVPGSFTTLPLTGDWVQTAGVLNANGIAETPDHQALLVVQSNSGFLFRVNPRTGVARRVDLGATLLTNGDGLLVRGRTLYAVRNQLNQVAVVRLNQRGTAGELRRTLTSADFQVPTTVAAYRGSLYLPNARFGAAAPETLDYAVIRLQP